MTVPVDGRKAARCDFFDGQILVNDCSCLVLLATYYTAAQRCSASDCMAAIARGMRADTRVPDAFESVLMVPSS